MIDRYNIDFSTYLMYSEESPTGLIWQPRSISCFPSEAAANRFHGQYAYRPAGTIVLDKQSEGYSSWSFKFNGKHYKNAIVIYLMMIGDIPDGYEVDHRNGNSLENKIANLRLATRSQNNINRRAFNKLGIKGVYEVRGKFESRIVTKDGLKFIGRYDTAEEAGEAYKRVSLRINGLFAKNN